MALSRSQRDEEAALATFAYQLYVAWSLARSVSDAAAAWTKHMPQDPKPGEGSAWLPAVAEVTMRRKREARRAGLAFFRLLEAIESKPGQLPERRKAFARYARVPANFRAAPLSGGARAGRLGRDYLEALDAESDAEIERLAELDEADERRAARDLERLLAASGEADLRERNQRISDDLEAQRREREAAKNWEQSGAGQASAAGKAVLDGGRGAIMHLLQGGRETNVAYARVSANGNACYFCRMLMSRGAVYKTANSTLFSEGNRYHVNCACTAIPVFSIRQYEESPVFAANRELSELWPEVTKGLSGPQALKAWRKYHSTRRATPEVATNALEAAA